MKKHLLIFTFLLITGTLSAQQDKPGGGRIEALKIAYLTKKLDLSPAEAQKFWPVYNSYSAELRSAKADQRRGKTQELDAEDKILNIRKKYSAEFSKIISEDKVNTLFRSEKEFGNYVQKELQERRQLQQGLRQ